MSDHPQDCGNEPHTHKVHGAFYIHGRCIVLDHQIIAMIPAGATHLADRIVELLARHGITDIPDTPAELCPWPAPDPTDRIIDYLPEHRSN